MQEAVIVSSRKDQASSNIAQALIQDYSFEKTSRTFEGNYVSKYENIYLVSSGSDIIYVDGLDGKFSPRTYVFISRHRSESGIPTLTAHFTGNFSDDASYGGRPRELSYTFPSLLKEYMKRIAKNAQELSQYHIVLEPTHHGPTTLRSPVLFVELGSTEDQWKDRRAAQIIAHTLVDTIVAEPDYPKVGVGFGGTHYSTKFTQFLLSSDYALGAVAPKYTLGHLDRSMVQQMINKCVEKVTYAILEWKSLGPERQKILDLVNDAGLKILKI